MAIISRIPVLAILLLSACTTSATPTSNATEQPQTLHSDALEYVAVDNADLVLQSSEEDWCNTLEGRAGGWLIADELELVFYERDGETFSLDAETRRLLAVVAAQGDSEVTPDELAQLDTFLRFPVPSPLACRTAFEARDK